VEPVAQAAACTSLLIRAVDITRESDGEFQQLAIFTELQAAHDLPAEIQPMSRVSV
jgi:hypothetical protein